MKSTAYGYASKIKIEGYTGFNSEIQVLRKKYLPEHTHHSDDVTDLVEKLGNILRLGVHTDGKIYIFADGVPIGDGIEISTKEPESEIKNLAGTISVGRLGSDGTIRNDADMCRVTDYVSVKNGDVVRCQGICFSANEATYGSVTYNSSKTKLSSTALANGSNSYYTVNSTTNNSAQITIISNDVAFVRFSGRSTGADTDIIVTVNQEIK